MTRHGAIGLTTAAVLASAACGKATSSPAAGPAGGLASSTARAPSTTPAPPDTGPTAALWAFAPAGTTMGIVADGDALAAYGAQFVHAPAGSWPTLLLSFATGSEATDLVGCGIDLHLGAARFVATAGTVWVVPTSAPDRFATCHHGTVARIDGMTCATRRGRYVCVDAPALLDVLGKDTAAIRGDWPVLFRGDAEAWASPAAVEELRAQNPNPPAFDVRGPAFAAARVTRGAVTFRGRAAIHWLAPLATLAGRHAPVAPHGTSGFVALAVGPIVDLWAEDTPRIQLLPGITSRDAVHALDGDVQARALSGAATVELRFGLGTPSVIRALVARCDDVVRALGLRGGADDDACRIDVDAGGTTFHLDGHVEGAELRVLVSMDGADGHAVPVPLTPIGGELGNGTWTFVAWGRGSAMVGPWQRLGRDLPATDLAWLSVVSEAGLGLRVDDDRLTALAHIRLITSDPDDVVHALLPLASAMTRHDDVAAQAEAIATRFPKSPFAADLRAGWLGLMAPTAWWAAMYVDVQLAKRPR